MLISRSLVSKRKSQPKKTKKTKKIRKKSRELPIDNPSLRHRGTTVDMYVGIDQKNIKLSSFRVTALEHANQMPNSDNAGFGVTTEDKVSVPPIPGASNWVQVGPTAIPYGQSNSAERVLVTGRVTAIVAHPSDSNIIYVGTAQGGIWKTTDGGRNWIAKSDYEISLAIGALVIDPNVDPKGNDILYAGTGEGNILFGEAEQLQQSYYGCGVLKTTNGGEEWKAYGGDEDSPLNGARFYRLAISPIKPSIIFAATTYGLYRSTNNGEDWKQMTKGLPSRGDISAVTTDVVANPMNPSIAYAAFWASGVYKTTNADGDEPLWTELKKLPHVSTSNRERIALGISSSSPDVLYALVVHRKIVDNTTGKEDDIIDKLYRTTDGGNSWNEVPISVEETRRNGPNDLGGQGTYNLNVAVDPTTPDIIYLSGLMIWKGVRNKETNNWTITNIGKDIHSDNHAFAFNPSNHLIIYAGNDGGIYRSYDGGDTWDDTINEGLCITQFGYIDQHPSSDALLIGGTQDNGTLQFRNSPAFYHSADGDGGFVAIDPEHPNIMLHEYYNPSPERSEVAGRYGRKNIESGGSWVSTKQGLSGSSLFYPPFTLDQLTSSNIAFGTDRVFLDRNQGINKWRASEPISLNPLNDQKSDGRGRELVSAICYINSDPGLIYVGTNYGKIFRLSKNGTKWIANPIYAPPLPSLYVWDIVPLNPDTPNLIIVVMAGVGTTDNPLIHVWRGEVADGNIARWFDISGHENGRLPNTPVNCIAIEPDSPQIMYIGTDVGVFKTSNGGDIWTKFSQGLPNCPVFDMRLHNPSRLLRAATHGRGMWEIKLDEQTMPDVILFVRKHLMDTGRSPSSTSPNITAAFENPFPIPLKEEQPYNVKLGEELSWDICPDIKIDPPIYDFENLEDVDYIKFETKLLHRNPERGRVNHIYVQIHNRGIKAAGLPPTNYKVSIKLFYADASHEYPALPQDFWTHISDNTFDKSIWKPIGETKFLPSPPKTLTNTEPTILQWDWNPGADVPGIIGLLTVIDSPEDPIPETTKEIFNIESLVTAERRVGLKRLNVVNV